jgi:hypothetical protein
MTAATLPNWDFDDAPTYEKFVAIAKECGLEAVVDCIVVGYCDRTPGNRFRWLVRRPAQVELDENDRSIWHVGPGGWKSVCSAGMRWQPQDSRQAPSSRGLWRAEN